MKKLQWPHIKKGDTVLIHSSIKRTCKEKNVTPADILESFIDAVGPDGTLLFPIFNFDWCHGEPYHFGVTKSKMGALTNEAMNYPGAVITGHPMSGYCAIGKTAYYFDGIMNTHAYVGGSPLVYLHEMNGKIAVLDCTAQDSLTFIHYVEQTIGVWWRTSKWFSGRYTNKAGLTTERTFELYVKHKNAETNADPLNEILWSMGLWRGDRNKVGSGLRVIQAEPLFNVIATIMKYGAGNGLDVIWQYKDDPVGELEMVGA